MCCDGSRRQFLHLVYDVDVVVLWCRCQPSVCRLGWAEVRAREVDLGVLLIPRGLDLVALSGGRYPVPGLQILALSSIRALQSLLGFQGFLEFGLYGGVPSSL